MIVSVTGTYHKETKLYKVNGHVLTEEEAECIATLYHTVQSDAFANVDNNLENFEVWDKGK